MTLGLCLLTTIVLACAGLLASAARRTGDRRDHPEPVTFADVANLLVDDASTPPAVADRVMARAAERQMTARTMWRWATAHGCDGLAAVVDDAIAEDTLLDHLDAGTRPERRSDALSRVLPLDEVVDLDAVPVLDRLTFSCEPADASTDMVEPHQLRRFDDLPPIAGPGLSTLPPTAA